MSAAVPAEQLVWGAVVDGVLVAAAGLAFNDREKTRHKATLFGMYVRQGNRGGGIANSLLRVLIDDAGQLGYVRVISLMVT